MKSFEVCVRCRIHADEYYYSYNSVNAVDSRNAIQSVASRNPHSLSWLNDNDDYMKLPKDFDIVGYSIIY